MCISRNEQMNQGALEPRCGTAIELLFLYRYSGRCGMLNKYTWLHLFWHFLIFSLNVTIYRH